MTMPSRRPRMTVLLALAGIGAASLTACGSSGGPPAAVPSGSVAAAATNLSKCDPAKSTLSLTTGAQGVAAVNVAVKEMATKYPGLKINVTASKSTHYPDLTQEVVSDIAVGKTPDIIMSGLNYLRFWVDQYHPAPIDPAALPSGYRKQFLPAGTVDGKVYLAPFQVSLPVLLVNTDLLRQAGVNPSTPITTYAQLVATAQAVTAKTGKPSVNLSTDRLGDWFAQALVQGAGGTFAAPDGAAAFNTALGQQALGLWGTLAKDKVLLPIGYLDGFAQFEAGKLPFFFAASSYISQALSGIGSKFSWKAQELPALTAQGAGDAPSGGNGWVVLSQDSCRAAYANVMVGLMLGKDASLAASGAGYSYIPVNSDAAASLLSSSDVPSQLRFAWTYAKPLTNWDAFKGNNIGPIIQALTDMASKLQGGAPNGSTVNSTVTQINDLEKG